MALLKWAFANYGEAGVELVRLGYTKQQILSTMAVHGGQRILGDGKLDYAIDDKWREQA